jgi:hypothetical protein
VRIPTSRALAPALHAWVACVDAAESLVPAARLDMLRILGLLARRRKSDGKVDELILHQCVALHARSPYQGQCQRKKI